MNQVLPEAPEPLDETLGEALDVALGGPLDGPLVDTSGEADAAYVEPG